MPMMEDTSESGIFTAVVHAGEEPSRNAGSLTTPIYRTSVYGFGTLETAAAVHEGSEAGFFYGRMGNPTQSALESAMAQLEGAESALCTASGMAAIAYALLTILKPGDELVTQPTLYTTSRLLLEEFLGDHGIHVRYARENSADGIVAEFTDRTAAVYVETPANPTLEIVDLSAVAAEARVRGIISVADNTFATPFNQTPLGLGFDVVCGGHGDLMAGVLCGPAEIIDRARWQINKLLGAVISPDSAWLVLRGLKTLAVRMERHNASALELAEWLRTQPGVETVNYPGLRSHLAHDVATRQMRGFGGMLSFTVRDTQAAADVVNNVRLCSLGVSLGDVATLIQVSAAMTQAALIDRATPDNESERIVMHPGLIRLSVGLESVEDLKQDLETALSS